MDAVYMEKASNPHKPAVVCGPRIAVLHGCRSYGKSFKSAQTSRGLRSAVQMPYCIEAVHMEKASTPHQPAAVCGLIAVLHGCRSYAQGFKPAPASIAPRSVLLRMPAATVENSGKNSRLNIAFKPCIWVIIITFTPLNI
ncbi:MAG: hypothetical protein ACK417_07990 [Bacteroidia bacterium]